ncbi:Plastidial pyruvate kinase 2 [Acorus gramineus]|uniref:pyruvate kinase n=1 Tax=Acorus gramineus TaxID=55184 RepID=A0AAV9BKA6_ACOGR|nr:Plastidial pyruvate kinase 2 [Acorus gramineus]
MGNGGVWSKPGARRKTKIVCTIGPSTNTREMIWKLAEAGMNVARLNMSHGDHASHQKVIDLVKEYNAQSRDNPIAIMLDTKAMVARGDLGAELPIEEVPLLQKQSMVKEGEEIALVQSGRQSIWRSQSTHNIQVRKV